MDETVVDQIIESGFSKLPPQKVTPYYPPSCKNDEAVYITIKHTDVEGNEFFLCTDLVRR